MGSGAGHLGIPVAMLATSISLGANAQEPARPTEPSDARLYADWSGPYLGIGASAGGAFGRYRLSPFQLAGAALPAFTSGFGQRRDDTPFFAGGFAGYNWQIEQAVLGVESEIAAATLKRSASSDFVPGFAGADPAFDLFRFKRDRNALVRARLGFAFEDYLLYVTGGLAHATVLARPNVPGVGGVGSESPFGVTYGFGMEAIISPHFSLGIDYRRAQFGRGALLPLGDLSSAGFSRVQFISDDVMARLTWFPQGLTRAPETPASVSTEPSDWSIHGQTTFVQQAVPRFRSPYTGEFSFLPRQGRETWTVTGYIGRRLWEGAEVYYNPELNQGFGLSNTLGIAGYINGEAQKAGAPFPFFRHQRYFLRQVIGLGGETETVQDGLNQIAGTRDVDRITITVGKFAVGDIFDDNAYAHDPRITFNNWSLWANTAVDFPANLPGLTEGAVIDLNRRDWALRVGYFLVPVAPNNNTLDDRNLDRAGGGIIEYERRFQLFDQPGKLRLGLFRNRGNSASYAGALALAGANPGLDPTDAAVAGRRYRFKSGAYANLEQALSETVGVFARASFNDGRNEILSFTDVDRMISGGVSIKGVSWDRPHDTIGIGAAINGLSDPHRAYLAAGGLGLLIGDGRLNYSTERAFETYYSAKLATGLNLTLDYQFVTNPGYNADRGPVHALGTRLHAEF